MARTFYDVLMISPKADRELISVVYRHLAKRYHPDRDDAPAAEARMAELNEAWTILRDPAKRRRYDERVGLRTAPSVDVPPSAGRPARRGGASPVRQTPEASPHGEAGVPPATPSASGSTLTFGRYRGWALDQVERVDPDYLDWLSRSPMGRNHRHELDELRRKRRR